MFFYNQMFNPQYVNPIYYRQIQDQIAQYNYEQDREVMNAVKAVRDLCGALKKMDEEHQQKAFYACLIAMAKESGWN